MAYNKAQQQQLEWCRISTLFSVAAWTCCCCCAAFNVLVQHWASMLVINNIIIIIHVYANKQCTYTTSFLAFFSKCVRHTPSSSGIGSVFLTCNNQ